MSKKNRKIYKKSLSQKREHKGPKDYGFMKQFLFLYLLTFLIDIQQLNQFGNKKTWWTFCAFYDKNDLLAKHVRTSIDSHCKEYAM